MDKNTFNSIVKNRLQHCTTVLESKDKEYSSDTDRLHNFVAAGRKLDCTPIKALQGMEVKHDVSIEDIINKMEKNDLYVPSQKLIDDKITDRINYLLLAEGLIEDRRVQVISAHDTYKSNQLCSVCEERVSKNEIVQHFEKQLCSECNYEYGFHSGECSLKPKLTDIPPEQA